MLESQRVLFELRGSLARRYSTGISWTPDRQQSKNRTSLRRSRLDELRLEERNEARFLLEYLVCRLLLEKKNVDVLTRWQLTVSLDTGPTATDFVTSRVEWLVFVNIHFAATYGQA